MKDMSKKQLKEYRKARKQGLKYWRNRAKENMQQEQNTTMKYSIKSRKSLLIC